MLLAQLQEVTEIDNQIGDMHRRLADLYQTRSKLMGITSVENLPTNSIKTINDYEQWYHEAAAYLEQYDIVVPAFTKLKYKFKKAAAVIETLSRTHPEIASKMKTIIVPQSRSMQLPIAAAMRKQQGLLELGDYIDSSLKIAKTDQTWQVLVVYAAQGSLYAGSSHKIMKNKAYLFAGYDMRGLGVREYAALSLQVDYPLDTDTWTVLLKDKPRKGQVPYVGYRQSQYRFELEETDNVLEDDGFRPALEM